MGVYGMVFWGGESIFEVKMSIFSFFAPFDVNLYKSLSKLDLLLQVMNNLD